MNAWATEYLETKTACPWIEQNKEAGFGDVLHKAWAVGNKDVRDFVPTVSGAGSGMGGAPSGRRATTAAEMAATESLKNPMNFKAVRTAQPPMAGMAAGPASVVSNIIRPKPISPVNENRPRVVGPPQPGIDKNNPVRARIQAMKATTTK